jgi:hypothetical protein
MQCGHAFFKVSSLIEAGISTTSAGTTLSTQLEPEDGLSITVLEGEEEYSAYAAGPVAIPLGNVGPPTLLSALVLGLSAAMSEATRWPHRFPACLGAWCVAPCCCGACYYAIIQGTANSVQQAPHNIYKCAAATVLKMLCRLDRLLQDCTP